MEGEEVEAGARKEQPVIDRQAPFSRRHPGNVLGLEKSERDCRNTTRSRLGSELHGKPLSLSNAEAFHCLEGEYGEVIGNETDGSVAAHIKLDTQPLSRFAGQTQMRDGRAVTLQP